MTQSRDMRGTVGAYRALAVLGSWACVVAQHQHPLSIIFDTHFSDTARQAIRSMIASHESCTNAQTLCTILQQKVPAVAQVTRQRTADGELSFSVGAIVPLTRIDDERIVSNCGQVVHRQWFSAECLEQVPYLCVADRVVQHEQLPYVVTELLASIPGTLLKKFEVAVDDVHRVWLHDKSDQDFYVMCSSVQLPDEQQLNQYAHIKQVLRQNDISPRHDGWVLDLRFDNQVVAYRANSKGVPHA